MRRNSLLFAVVAGVLLLAMATVNYGAAMDPIKIEVNNTSSLYKLRGDGPPDSLPSVYQDHVDCVIAQAQSNGKVIFFTAQHAVESGCFQNPVRFLTIDKSGLPADRGTDWDFDEDGVSETVETVVADVTMDKLFASTTTPVSVRILRTVDDGSGGIDVEGGSAWKIEYAEASVTVLSASVRRVTGSSATVCEMIVQGKRNVCRSYGTINLPFEFVATR